jgi:hypothetical protein
MKTNFLHLLALIAFLQLGAALRAAAQDGLPNPELSGFPNQEVNPYDDKPLIYEHELKNNSKIVRDTASTSRSNSSNTSSAAKTKSAPSTEVRKPNNSRGDDPLNFNFLYYIIHKFKSSDLIDE